MCSKTLIKQFFFISSFLTSYCIFIKFLKFRLMTIITSKSDLNFEMKILFWILILCMIVYFSKVSFNIHFPFYLSFGLYLITISILFLITTNYFGLTCRFSPSIQKELNELKLQVVTEYPHLFSANALKKKVYVPCSEMNSDSTVDLLIKCAEEKAIDVYVERSLKCTLFFSYLFSVLFYVIYFECNLVWV
jgi:hypothetical protein